MPRLTVGELTHIEQTAQSLKEVHLNAWIAYDSGLKTLDRTFEIVMGGPELPYGNLSEYVDWYQAHFGCLPTGLEMAGQGRTFVDLGIQGIAVCLGAPPFLRDEGNLIRAGSQGTVTFVEGDITQPATLVAIEEARQQREMPLPSLVLFDPAGGFRTMPESASFYCGLIADTIGQLAAPQGLLFLGEYPTMVKIETAIGDSFRRDFNIQTVPGLWRISSL